MEVLMKKLKSITLKNLRNEELQGFCASILKIIDENGNENDKVLVAALRSGHEALITAVSKDGVTYSESIQNADTLADQAWSCINNQLKINMMHYKEDVREAATEVYAAFSAYDNPTNLPYIEEYARMELIINALDEQPKDHLGLVMIDGWLEELKKRCDEFHKCMDAKQDAKAAKETGAGLAARKAIYDAWSSFAETFNATLVLHPDDAHEKMCDSLNTVIDERNQALKTRRTLKSKATT